MKKSFFLLLFFIGFTNLIVNAQNGTNKIKLPVTGGEFEYLKRGVGSPGNIGDFIYFSFVIIGDDGSIINDRREKSSWVKDEIKNIDSSAFPIVEMFQYLVPGDSVKYEMVLQDGQSPPGFENLKSVFYYLKAEKIVDMETEQREIEEKKALSAQREQVVATEVAKLLNDYKSGALKDQIMKTGSGLEYVVVEKGNGAAIQKNEAIEVDYYGIFKENGNMFDNSFSRGQKLPFKAGMGQMIKGFDEAMLFSSHGDKIMLFLPYQLAYGEAGRPPQIPAKSDLCFYVEIQ